MVQKAHIYFWATALIVFLWGWFAYGQNDVFDINVHDTYYVIASRHLGIMLSILYAFTAFFYTLWPLFKLRLHELLTLLHTIIMVGGLFLCWVMCRLILFSAPEHPKFPLFDNSGEAINNIVLLFFALFVLVQPLFIINLIIGAFRKEKN